MTTIKLPRRFATDQNYLVGPDVGTPTKVDVGTTGSGFIRGAIAAAQNFNYEIGSLTSATRRPLTVATLLLRPLDDGGSTPSDTTASLGVAQTNVESVLVVKGGANGVFRFMDFPLAEQSGIAVAAITTECRKVIGNGAVGSATRFLAIGAGGNRNAFTTDVGNTWTAGGAPGTASLVDGIWDGADFIVMASDETTWHSTSGVAWTAATGGSDLFDILTGGTQNGVAVLNGNTFAAGAIGSNIAFAESTNHGLTWFNSGGTVASPGTYNPGRGYLVGNGGSEIYWVGQDGSALRCHASSDGVTWTLRSSITGLNLGADSPKLFMCQSTGMLVVVIPQTIGGIVAHASFDRGLTWTERFNTPAASVNAFAVAHGKLYCTVGAKLFASDGIGAE